MCGRLRLRREEGEKWFERRLEDVLLLLSLVGIEIHVSEVLGDIGVRCMTVSGIGLCFRTG